MGAVQSSPATHSMLTHMWGHCVCTEEEFFAPEGFMYGGGNRSVTAGGIRLIPLLSDPLGNYHIDTKRWTLAYTSEVVRIVYASRPAYTIFNTELGRGPSRVFMSLLGFTQSFIVMGVWFSKTAAAAAAAAEEHIESFRQLQPSVPIAKNRDYTEQNIEERGFVLRKLVLKRSDSTGSVNSLLDGLILLRNRHREHGEVLFSVPRRFDPHLPSAVRVRVVGSAALIDELVAIVRSMNHTQIAIDASPHVAPVDCIGDVHCVACAAPIVVVP